MEDRIMKKDYTIAVAGTGYVGLSIATLLSQHHKVMAVDIVKEKVDLINNRKSPIQDNYIMQAFALQNKIIALGYNNDIINYVPDKMEKLSFFCKSSARFVTLKAKVQNKKIQSKFLTAEEWNLKNIQMNLIMSEN